MRIVPLLPAISSLHSPALRPTKIGISLAAAVGLSACAMINPPKPLPPAVATTAPMTTLKAAGLTHPQTVWVPAFYTSGNDSLLFIDGRQYRAPNGAGNVVGFIPTATGYTVAVENVPSPSVITNGYGMPVGRLQRGARLELFSVTKTGKTLQELGSLPLYKVSEVFQTKSAFYLQKNTGWVQEQGGGGELPMFSYYGLSASGQEVSGPSNVLYATPAKGGGWYKDIVTGTNALGAVNSHVLLVQNGRVISSRDGEDSFNSPIVYFHAPSVFVNEPPVVDSERTGYMMAACSFYNPIGQGNVQNTSFGAINPAQNSLNQIHQSIQRGLGDAVVFALREAIVSTDTGPARVGQLENLNGPVYVGYKDLTTGSKHPIFPMVNGLEHFAGIFAGGNAGGQEVINGKVDAFTVITPKGAVLINAYGSQIGAGYALYAKAQIPALDMEQFASQYGLMP